MLQKFLLINDFVNIIKSCPMHKADLYTIIYDLLFSHSKNFKVKCVDIWKLLKTIVLSFSCPTAQTRENMFFKKKSLQCFNMIPEIYT